MKQIKTQEDIKSLGTILGIWAHPDDESWLAAGVMATAVENGQKVACVTATRGEAGSQDEKRWPPSQLAEIRTKELDICLSLLKVTDHTWLDYADGKCERVPADQAAAKILEIIRRVQPQSILTFDSKGMTGHPDHIAVSNWADQAAKQSGIANLKIYHAVHTPQWYEEHGREFDQKLNVFYNIDKPPLVDPSELAIQYRLPEKMRKLKIRALKAQPSQIEVITKTFGDKKFFEAVAEEKFIEAKG